MLIEKVNMFICSTCGVIDEYGENVEKSTRTDMYDTKTKKTSKRYNLTVKCCNCKMLETDEVPFDIFVKIFF